jgi:hypothetical protein
MDSIRGKKVASSSDFTFRSGPPKIRSSSKESGLIRIRSKTREASGHPLGKLRAFEDTKGNTLTIEKITRVNCQ